MAARFRHAPVWVPIAPFPRGMGSVFHFNTFEFRNARNVPQILDSQVLGEQWNDVIDAIDNVEFIRGAPFQKETARFWIVFYAGERGAAVRIRTHLRGERYNAVLRLRRMSWEEVQDRNAILAAAEAALFHADTGSKSPGDILVNNIDVEMVTEEGKIAERGRVRADLETRQRYNEALQNEIRRFGDVVAPITPSADLLRLGLAKNVHRPGAPPRHGLPTLRYTNAVNLTAFNLREQKEAILPPEEHKRRDEDRRRRQRIERTLLERQSAEELRRRAYLDSIADLEEQTEEARLDLDEYLEPLSPEAPPEVPLEEFPPMAAAPHVPQQAGPSRPRLGAYDQELIELARPGQTLEWYHQNRGRIWPIRNEHDNLCLFYAMVMAQELSEYRGARLEITRLQAAKQPIPKEVAKAGAYARLREVEELKNSFVPRSRLRKLAFSLAREVVPNDRNKLSQREFTLDDVVRLHNHFRTLIILLTCEVPGQPWTTFFRSDEAEGMAVDPIPLDRLIRPVVYMLYSPSPANHVDLLPDPEGVAAWLGAKKATVCRVCLQTYTDLNRHRCVYCPDCKHHGCSASSLTVAWSERKIICSKCNMRFKSDDCRRRHYQPNRGGRAEIRGQSIQQARDGVSVVPEGMVDGKRSRTAKSACEEFIWCADCRKRMSRMVRLSGSRERVEHKCGYMECAHCHKYADVKHKCYVTRGEPKESGDYVFFDCECNVNGVHKPYLIRIHDGLLSDGGYDANGDWVGEPNGDHDSAGRQVKFFFEGENSVDQFIQWMLRKQRVTEKGFTIIAHNGSGYDWVVIYRELVLWGGGQLAPKPLYRGSALISIRIGQGESAIRFADSMLFAPGKLADYPSMFGIATEMKEAGFSGNKEHFPHWLLSGASTDYEGDFPPKEAYRPDLLPDQKRREEFDKWYASEARLYSPATEAKWSFMRQARDYCNVDVEILRRAMRVFIHQFMTLTQPEDENKDSEVRVNLVSGVDPLQFTTLPGACWAAFRLYFMPKKSIANLPVPVDRVMRKSLMGGRTEGRRFYFPGDIAEDGKVKYYDFNSLYPTVMVKYPFPRGYPRFFGNHRSWPLSCVNLTGPAELKDLETKYLKPGTLSILEVDLVCPKTLYWPVLGVHEQRPGETHPKLRFTLDDKKFYWTNSAELRKAISVGYRVTAVHSVAWWDEKHVAPAAVDEKGNVQEGSLWGKWVRTFMPVKDEASGWPDECKTDEEKAEFLEAYARWPLNQGQRLRPDRIKKNAGLKTSAKLPLNSLWGKSTQRPNMPQTRLFYAHEATAFFELIFSEEWDVQRVIPIKESEDNHVMEVVYVRPEGYFGQDPGCNGDHIADRFAAPRDFSAHATQLGVFVTAYARLELYEQLERGGASIFYCDTDSIVELERTANATNKVGPFLGQLKDELNGEHIVSWFCGGPKNYGYVTNNDKSKSVIKGLRRAAFIPSFQDAFVRASVIASAIGQTAPAPQLVSHNGILRERKNQEVRSRENVFKAYKVVNDKVHVFEDGTSLPYGHVGIANTFQEFARERKKWQTELDTLTQQLVGARRAQSISEGKDPDEEQPDPVQDRLDAQRDRMLARVRRLRNEVQMLLDPDEEFEEFDGRQQMEIHDQ